PWSERLDSQLWTRREETRMRPIQLKEWGVEPSPVSAFGRKLSDEIGRVIVGKADVIELLAVALLCEGHVLIEAVPGIGKTTLAKTLARCVQGSFGRIQFTPDLLPSDVTGIFFFNQRSGDFEFRAGPIHASVVLADEIN